MAKIIRINEDWLDDIDLAPRQTQAQTLADMDDERTSNDTFDRVFVFSIAALPKGRQMDWYLTRMKKFVDMFTYALDLQRCIKDWNHDIVLIMYGLRDENESVIEEPVEGVRIKHGTKYDLESVLNGDKNKKYDRWFHNNINIHLGVDANVDTIAQIRKLMMSLWKCFDGSVRSVFRSQASPNGCWLSRNNSKFECSISTGGTFSYGNWKEMPESFDRYLISAYRALHPDVMPKAVKAKIAEFRETQDTGRQRNESLIRSILTRLFLYTGKDERVEIDDKGNVDILMSKDQKWNPYSFRGIYDYLTKEEGRLLNITICNLREIRFRWSDIVEGRCQKLLQMCPDVETIYVYISCCDSFCRKYNNRTLDLTAIFPGYDVRAVVTDTKLDDYRKNNKDYRKSDWTFSVKTSKGTKKYEAQTAEYMDRGWRP